MRLAPVAIALLVCSDVVAKPAPMPRADIDQDVAALEQALADGWAWSSRSTIDTFKALPARIDEAAQAAGDAPALCAGLAEALRTTGVTLELAGARCGGVAPVATAPDRLDTVPARRNYLVRFDRAKDHDIAIVTIAHFVDPADAGWKGFAAAMLEVAKRELVIIDLQNADGDDPRAGFALLAAIGREDYDRAYLHPAMFRDGPAGKTARAAFQALHRPAPAPRDRKLWSMFATGDDVKRIAREIVPGLSRTTPAVKSPVLVGAGCGRACQLVVELVQWSGVDITGGFVDTVTGDEPGAVVLPHSGITATFPTAAYGTYNFGSTASQQMATGAAGRLLAGLHELGHARAQSLAWRTRALPACTKLPSDPKLLQTKAYGCREQTSPGPGAIESVQLRLTIDSATAARFLATCNLQQVGGSWDTGADGASEVTVYGTRAQLVQILAAPFVQYAQWPCPTHVEPN